MKTAIFRVDSSYEIGTGHVMRCLNLARVLLNYGLKVIFICRNLKGNLINVIKNEFQVLVIEDYDEEKNKNNDKKSKLDFSINQKLDSLNTIKLIESLNIENFCYLIIDHYFLDREWEEVIQKKYKNDENKLFKILVIDDLFNREHSCDFILDQNIITKNNPYLDLINQNTKSILGPYFALLSNEYSLKKKSIVKRNTIKTILVFFGGIDKNNMTKKVINILSNNKFKDKIVNIVIGKNNKELQNIKKITKSRKNFNLFIQIDSLANLLSVSDLVIGGGGVNSWERECMEVPTILISLSENQVNLAKSITDLGKVKYLGHYDELEDGFLSQSIEKEIDQQSLRNKKGYFIDGFGTNRVALLLVGLQYPVKLQDISKYDLPVLNYWLSALKQNRSFKKILNKQKTKGFILKNNDHCPLFIFDYYHSENQILDLFCIYDPFILIEEDILRLFIKSIFIILKKIDYAKVLKLNLLNEINSKNNKKIIKNFLRRYKIISNLDDQLLIDLEKFNLKLQGLDKTFLINDPVIIID